MNLYMGQIYIWNKFTYGTSDTKQDSGYGIVQAGPAMSWHTDQLPAAFGPRQTAWSPSPGALGAAFSMKCQLSPPGVFSGVMPWMHGGHPDVA